MALLGALASGFLLLVFPCLFYVKLYGLRRIGWVNLVACIMICVIGVLCAAIGTVDAITALVKDFQGVA
jgi:amino acid permease